MKRPAVMGLRSVTPDLFLGHSQLCNAEAGAAERLVAEGVGVLDIGAESTRLSVVALGGDVEWDRLAPVLMALARRPWLGRVRLSIDTRNAPDAPDAPNAPTAARTLALGLDFSSGVTGRPDTAMHGVLRTPACDVAATHALSVPVDPAQSLSVDIDARPEILRWKAAVTARGFDAGPDQARLIHDPGIGFGNTARRSLTQLHGAAVRMDSAGQRRAAAGAGCPAIAASPASGFSPRPVRHSAMASRRPRRPSLPTPVSTCCVCMPSAGTLAFSSRAEADALPLPSRPFDHR